jgi:hypothetical protein
VLTRWTARTVGGLLGLVGLVGTLAALANGCGPSAQAIYEGNVRFEHCYRLDLDKDIAPTHRVVCWREWVATYSYGQTSDRFVHARRRIQAIEAGETSPPELDLDGVSRAPAAPAEAPMPTSLHAPPPATAPAPKGAVDGGADAGASQAEKALPSLPREDCRERCVNVFRDCGGNCERDAGTGTAGCAGCEKDYLGCVRRCFK